MEIAKSVFGGRSSDGYSSKAMTGIKHLLNMI